MTSNAFLTAQERALESHGASSDPVYQMVVRALADKFPICTIADVGCGAGRLYNFLGDRCDRYLGIDVVRYPDLPEAIEFVPLDLDTGAIPLSDGIADVVVAVEVIEHLENPRAFVRQLARLAKPGGLVVVTTPNNLSLLSKLTLVLKLSGAEKS